MIFCTAQKIQSINIIKKYKIIYFLKNKYKFLSSFLEKSNFVLLKRRQRHCEEPKATWQSTFNPFIINKLRWIATSDLRPPRNDDAEIYLIINTVKLNTLLKTAIIILKYGHIVKPQAAKRNI